MGERNWGTYWREVCAPKMLARKKELGRAVSEREIAAAVETATGKPSERALVWMWLHGEREPFIGQFFALCEKMGLAPFEVLEPPRGVRQRTPLRQINEKSPPQRKVSTVRRGS